MLQEGKFGIRCYYNYTPIKMFKKERCYYSSIYRIKRAFYYIKLPLLHLSIYISNEVKGGVS